MVNVGSRTGLKACDVAVETLRDVGVPLHAVYRLSDASRLPETVSGAIDAGHDLVVLGGGDGTVSAAVDVLAHREVPIGLLPLGTANDFARTMHIPTDIDGACRTIADGHVVDVDLGLCGDNYYVNRASVGMGAHVAQAMSPWLKRRLRPLAYPTATVKALLRHQPFRARLTFPDGDHEPCEFPRLMQVSVANGRYFGGGQQAVSDAGIDDDALDVTVIRHGGPLQMASIAREMRSGSEADSAHVTHIRTRRVEVHTDDELPINIDGEVVAQTPQVFALARNALHVVAPQTWVDGTGM
ncbi:diacylglycerol/lipid kinase family protein [Amycolatopsis palatopharyngis]|uniref:diacylglycerol/lipid kinase family protein n=1 Tax=Amycolatopsis palatopharyngis TaxID=187982 RepID=UPI002482C45C|nr:YegS/Rv2252/BmrU family lipid kinase [Amycolatopsis palatopharyngis]